MAGFLNLLGPLATTLGIGAPIANTAGAIMVNNQNVAQRNATEAAFGKTLDTLGPDYEWARQMYKQGGPQSAHDVAAAIGSPFGKAIQEAGTAQELSDFMSKNPNATPEETLRFYGMTSGHMEPWASVLAAQARSAGKEAPLTTQQMADSLMSDSTLPGLDPNYANSLRIAGSSGNPAQIKNAYEGAKNAIPQELKPLEPKTKDVSGIYDPSTQLFLKGRDILDPRTMRVTGRELVGIDFNAQQKAQLDQAGEAMHFIPQAEAMAEHLDDRFRKVGWDTPKQRQWMNNQYRAYTAAREGQHFEPLDPRGWVFQHYDGVDDGANRYFTLMGQLSQQMAAPMGILRAVKMWDKISLHIPEPADLPANNLDRLEQAQQRFGYELERVRQAQDNLSNFPFIGRGTAYGAPAAAPAAPSPAAPSRASGPTKRMSDADADAAIAALMRP